LTARPLVVSLALVALMLPGAAGASFEFWPAMDAFVKLDDRFRLYFTAAFVRGMEPDATSGEEIYRDVTFGAHLDLTLKPIFRPRLRTSDWERQRYVWVRAGYRYGTTIGEVADPFEEHRGLLEQTGRAPLPSAFWLVERSRLEFRDVDDTSSTRLRFRLTCEREMPIGGRETIPYVNGELYYDFRADALKRQRYQSGVEVILTHRWRIEPYFSYQVEMHSDDEDVAALGLNFKYYR
jgi:hypothetical protein